jgi:NADPH:quinone reductase-like Zn-dependent oxidoreductase
VRLRVCAASLNPYDWHIYQGDPYIARLMFGLRGPGSRVVGSDVAGQIDAIGEGVTAFAVGDAVFGSIGNGGCGEYALASESVLALKPLTATFQQAAALPMGALTALQGLRGAGVGPGSRVLIIGASGGVGHLAVQIARILGAERVVAVCSGRNAGWVGALGADRVIDYTRETVPDAGEGFDVIFDTVATTPLRRLRPVMRPGCVYAPAGALQRRGLLGPAVPIFGARLAGPFLRRKVTAVNATMTGTDLDEVARWVDQGRLAATIDTVYPLNRYADALTRLEGQHVAGKLVVAVTP